MKKLLTIVAIALITAACHTTKQVTNTTYPSTDTTAVQPATTLDTRLTALATAQRGWTTMQAGGNVKVGGTKTFSSAMQMRMVRGKAIYISLRPLLGVEVGKIVITNDSVLVVDKYHKRYLNEPLSLITNGIPISVATLQDIFLGRAFVLGNGTVNPSTKHLVELKPAGQHFTLEPKSQLSAFTYAFTIDNDNHVLNVQVTPLKGATTPYTAHYDDIQQTLAGTIAHHADVAATVSGTKFTLDIDLKNITWNTQVNIDDSKPGDSYKRIDGKNITSILGND